MTLSPVYLETIYNAKIIMYADDTVLVVENNNRASAVEEMQEILSRTEDWCRRKKQTINAKKTKNQLVLRNKGLRETTNLLQ